MPSTQLTPVVTCGISAAEYHSSEAGSDTIHDLFRMRIFFTCTYSRVFSLCSFITRVEVMWPLVQTRYRTVHYLFFHVALLESHPPLLPLPFPQVSSPDNHSSCLYLYNFVMSRTSYKRNLRVCKLCRLAFFIQPNSPEIQAVACVSSLFLCVAE